MSEPTKPREFWIARADGLPSIIQTEWPGKYAHQYTHVREVSPETDAAVEELRKQLEAVLSWPLPGNTTVGKNSIPPWMLKKCKAALNAVKRGAE